MHGASAGARLPRFARVQPGGSKVPVSQPMQGWAGRRADRRALLLDALAVCAICEGQVRNAMVAALAQCWPRRS